jgi:hypothetical protein
MGDSVTEGLEMALYRILMKIYVVDILCCTINDNSWGIGKESCYNLLLKVKITPHICLKID